MTSAARQYAPTMSETAYELTRYLGAVDPYPNQQSLDSRFNFDTLNLFIFLGSLEFKHTKKEFFKSDITLIVLRFHSWDFSIALRYCLHVREFYRVFS